MQNNDKNTIEYLFLGKISNNCKECVEKAKQSCKIF
jgi:hypothetical protein